MQTTLHTTELYFAELMCRIGTLRLSVCKRPIELFETSFCKGRGDVEAIGEIAIQTLRMRSICASLNKEMVLHQVERPSRFLIAHLSARSYASCASTQADVFEVLDFSLAFDLSLFPTRIEPSNSVVSKGDCACTLWKFARGDRR